MYVLGDIRLKVVWDSDLNALEDSDLYVLGDIRLKVVWDSDLNVPGNRDLKIP